MSNEPRRSRVYKAINKPLTIWGAERRLFFLSMVAGAGTFNFFGSVAGGLTMFIALYSLARWATLKDPEILHILLNSSRLRSHYDPGKRAVFASDGVRG